MRSRGVTLVELVCVTAIILVLAGIAIPLGSTMAKRQKELVLRRELREMRQAIDRFQADVERIPGMRDKLGSAANEEHYPEELDWLYKGFDTGQAVKIKIKYLRRLPVDPMTGKADWATRSSRDRPGSHFTDGINIFDVHSKSEAVALDGTKYMDW